MFFGLELHGIKAELEETTTGQGDGDGRGGSERRRRTRSARVRERAEEGRGMGESGGGRGCVALQAGRSWRGSPARGARNCFSSWQEEEDSAAPGGPGWLCLAELLQWWAGWAARWLGLLEELGQVSLSLFYFCFLICKFVFDLVATPNHFYES